MRVPKLARVLVLDQRARASLDAVFFSSPVSCVARESLGFHQHVQVPPQPLLCRLQLPFPLPRRPPVQERKAASLFRLGRGCLCCPYQLTQTLQVLVDVPEGDSEIFFEKISPSAASGSSHAVTEACGIH